MNKINNISSVNNDQILSYWEKRQDFMYYKYIDILVRAFAANARSIIDVGSCDTPLLEKFDWIPRRVTLDKVNPYQSNNVISIKTDFLTYTPEIRYDFALCLQVLEHVPGVTQFAHHLFDVADNILVSVPFNWPKGETQYHVHDPVDLNKLVEWMGKKPDYHIFVTEPLRVKKAKRLIAYFQSNSNFSLKTIKARYLKSKIKAS